MQRAGSSVTYAGPTSEWLEERDVDAQLMKNGSASRSRVDERSVEMHNGWSAARSGRACVELSTLAREVRFDYLLVESTGISEPLPVAEPRLGRRTVLTLPLLPPPQKN